MGMEYNWKQFIDVTNAKRKGHLRAARYWNSVNSWLSLTLIFLAAITTFFSLVESIPNYAVSAVAVLSTLLSAVLAFLRAADRRQLQLQSSQQFSKLMMKMVRCETEKEYEQLWKDYNKVLSDEPFLPKKFAVKEDSVYSMTPELMEVIQEKDKIVHELGDKVNENLDGETNSDSKEKESSEKENKVKQNHQGCCLGKCFK